VLHRGPLDEQHVGLVQILEDVIGDDDAPANLAVRTVDLDQLPDDDAQELLEEADAPDELPWLLVRYPPFTRTDRPAFRGPLDDSAVRALVDSPARRDLVRRIGDGYSAVWVLVASGDRVQDEAAAQLLRERLRHLESTVDLSARDWYAPDPSLPPQPDTSATAQPTTCKACHKKPGCAWRLLVLAVITADTREPLFEIATIEKLVHDFRDDRTQEAVAGLVALLVALQERVEMPRQALPQRRFPGAAQTINLLHHAAQCSREDVSSNGTHLKKVLRK
jgi:hypothetical protein